MPTSRALPPQFLLPAWSPRQLSLLSTRVQHQSATACQNRSISHQDSSALEQAPKPQITFSTEKWIEPSIRRSRSPQASALPQAVRHNSKDSQGHSSEEPLRGGIELPKQVERRVQTHSRPQSSQSQTQNSFRSLIKIKYHQSNKGSAANFVIRKFNPVDQQQPEALQKKLQTFPDSINTGISKHASEPLPEVGPKPLPKAVPQTGHEPVPDFVPKTVYQLQHMPGHKQESKNTPNSRTCSQPKPARPTKPLRGAQLFEALFPEESAAAQKAAAERLLEKLPAFNWGGDLKGAKALEQKQKELEAELARVDEWKPKRAYKVSKAAKAQQEEERIREARREAWEDPEKRVRNAAVLLLSAVPGTLEESDFFRLSPMGDHIEGWTTGITKVIPARSHQTLRHLGFYFIIFTNDPSARAYLDNLIRLHQMSRQNRISLATGLPLSSNRFLKPGEDVLDTLRRFSIIPAQGRLSLRRLSRPFVPHVQKMLREGGHASLVKHLQGSGIDVDASTGRLETNNRILISSPHGRFSEKQLREALEIDGRARNLPWRLAQADDNVKSVYDISERSQQFVGEELREQKYHLEHNRREKSINRDIGRCGQEGNFGSGVPKPSRFMITLRDRHEARRFVREWHRRPLPIAYKYKVEDEEPPIVETEILW